MRAHELAKRLLQGPDVGVVVQVGEDSRDNPAYKEVSGSYKDKVPYAFDEIDAVILTTEE